MNQQCDGCKFWKHREDKDDIEPIGHCRRFPPSLASLEEEPGEPAKNAASILEPYHFRFPVTFHDDWCGEFKPKQNSVAPPLTPEEVLALPPLTKEQLRYAVAVKIRRQLLLKAGRTAWRDFLDGFDDDPPEQRVERYRQANKLTDPFFIEEKKLRHVWNKFSAEERAAAVKAYKDK